MFRKISGKFPEMFREMLLFLTLVPEQACPGTFPRPVPGTFLEELFLEHAHKLPRTIKGEAYELQA